MFSVSYAWFSDERTWLSESTKIEKKKSISMPFACYVLQTVEFLRHQKLNEKSKNKSDETRKHFASHLLTIIIHACNKYYIRKTKAANFISRFSELFFCNFCAISFASKSLSHWMATFMFFFFNSRRTF